MRFIPRWRKATWAVVIWTVLMVLWAVSASAMSTTDVCSTATYTDACQAGATIGKGIAVTLIFVIWFLGFIVFSLIWLMSRPQRRLCPVCGEQVKKGLMACPKCGYNFAQASSVRAAGPGAPLAAPVAMPPGVFPCYRCQSPVWQPMATCTACGAPLSWPTSPA
jgi:hypothetical protein